MDRTYALFGEIISTQIQKRRSMRIVFECKKCGKDFECEVGKISFPPDTERPAFENQILCPTC